MEWGWHQWLAFTAFILAAGAAWEVSKLKKHLHMEDLTPTKKWKKAISGPKHIPKHKPDEGFEHGNADENRFYQDFSRVADYLNLVYEDTPWSFENTGRLETGFGSEFGASREIVVRHNQQLTGFIKLTCIDYGDESFNDVSVRFDLLNGRIFDGLEVFGMAKTLGEIVQNSSEKRAAEIDTNILILMIDAMWKLGEEAHGNPEIKFTFSGKAEWYLKSAWVPSNQSIRR